MDQSDSGAPVGIQIRSARVDDAPFLAWVMFTAGRGHCRRGIWEMLLNRPEDKCLAFLRQLATTKTRHPYHYTGFVVAEVDGQPAAAVSGYDPKELGRSRERRGMWEAGRKVGITLWDWLVRNRKGINTVLSLLPKPAPGVWEVGAGAARPEFRRLGLGTRLGGEILTRGRQRGFRRVEVIVMIGNTPSQTALEKSGFRVLDEKRHPHFEAETGSPGIRRLVLDL